MKNIHVLPTEKPSRLLRNNLLKGKLELSEELLPWKTPQHIYITNSGEIKEGDWCVLTDVESVLYGQFEKHRGAYQRNSQWEKTVLTTDQDLIKDGVQAIDDEFLEWFVKNPSCEWAEVERDSREVGGHNGGIAIEYGLYEIIIPEEKPKQDCKHDIVIKYGVAECQNCGMEENEIVKEEPKYIMGIDPYDNIESLEEAAERYSEGWGKNDDAISFVAGAKWQAERTLTNQEPAEQIFDRIASKTMVNYDPSGFRSKYKTLFKTIILAINEARNQVTN